MRRRVLLLLTTMALVLAVASGTAMAEESILDRKWETYNSTSTVYEEGDHQTISAATTGTLDKVEVLVGCCIGTGAVASDLRLSVKSEAGSTSEIIPKENFTQDSSVHWESVTLGTPIPVQANKNYTISLHKASGDGGSYKWAVDTNSGFVWGHKTDCAAWYFNGRKFVECDFAPEDANFRTYVTPGPDLIPPQTILPASNPWSPDNGPPQGSTVGVNHASFSFSADEAGSTFECRLDDMAWEPCTPPKEYTDLSDGSHTFQVRAIDPSGNTDPTPESRQWFVDTTPPDTTITTKPSDPSDDSTPTFGFSGSDNVGGFECKLSGPGGEGAWQWCHSPHTYWSELPANGTYTFEVKAVDKFNRRDPTPASYTWTYRDTTAPFAPFIASPANNSYDNDGNFTVCGTAEPNSTVELFEGSASRGTAQANASRQWCIELRGVPEGSHTYKAKATDAAGNTSAESNSLSVTVDGTAPAAPSIVSPVEGSSVRGNFIVSGTAEAGSTVRLSEDTASKGTGTADSSGNWSINLAGVTEGSHIYKATATDAAGNVSAESAPRTVIVDATVPSAPIITSPANNSYDNDGSFSVSGTAEANSTVELFEVDPATGARSATGTPTTAGTDSNWSIPLSGVAEGNHTYVAKTTDAAGNASAESNSRTVIVDATVPTVTGKSPKPNSTGISPTANVIATFSEAMMQSSLNRTTVKLVRAGTTRAVGASLSYPAPNKVVLNPTDPLVRGATYRVTIVGGPNGAKDPAGNALAANVGWRFEVRV